MNPATYPFVPGAGTPRPSWPAVTSCWSSFASTSSVSAPGGRAAKSVRMIGLRGVGKTVLLDRMRDNAEGEGIHTLRMEAPESGFTVPLFDEFIRRIMPGSDWRATE